MIAIEENANVREDGKLVLECPELKASQQVKVIVLIEPADSPKPSSPSVPVYDVKTGQVLMNRFTLSRMLGRGGMGEVWLATDREMNSKEVALKFVPQHMQPDHAAMDELGEEAHRARKLTHPNIVRVYDFHQDDEVGFIVMEYVEGDTLQQMRMERSNMVFEADEIGKWVLQLCDALGYLHETARIVHHDLKPQNLMINKWGDIRIIGFSCSMSICERVGRGCTPHFASPQQMAGEPPSAMDDIYALGATIYSLLTSKPPFYSGDILRQMREQAPPSMTQRRKELGIVGQPIPKIWEETVAACLAKDPARRPQSALEIVRLLELAGPAGASRTWWYQWWWPAKIATRSLCRVDPGRPVMTTEQVEMRSAAAVNPAAQIAAEQFAPLSASEFVGVVVGLFIGFLCSLYVVSKAQALSYSGRLFLGIFIFVIIGCFAGTALALYFKHGLKRIVEEVRHRNWLSWLRVHALSRPSEQDDRYDADEGPAMAERRTEPPLSRCPLDTSAERGMLDAPTVDPPTQPAIRTQTAPGIACRHFDPHDGDTLTDHPRPRPTDDETRSPPPVPPVSVLAPGQPLYNGRFVLIRLIAAGGMGQVWLARDHEYRDEFALKFIMDPRLNSKDALNRLDREARKNKRLAHPNIVHCYGFERDNTTGVGFLQMEFIDGASLKALQLRQPGQVFQANDRLEKWLVQLCAALKYAHETAKLVHNDIKPGNILIDRKENLKLTDFGIAHAIEATQSPFTGGSAFISLHYASPKRIKGAIANNLDDIYS
ncbi:MAG: serine/threonine protein kinase, partial [Verrucomicrobia bacterium]|nr:serine/threonine protein kinase [Verrucomicrobiota bacterium]